MPAARTGQQVIYGVRPEHLDLSDSSGLSAEVVVVEPTGAEILVFARLAAQEIAVVFKERHRFQPGDKIDLTPHPARCICSTRPPAIASTPEAVSRPCKTLLSLARAP